MFTTSRTPAFWLALMSLILSASLGIAACALLTAGGPIAAPSPAAPTAQPGQPTAAPADPTAAPTAAPTTVPTAAPTAAPAAAIIGFNPKAGGPGTAIDVFGSGYTPGAWYVVRLGLPQPTGEALFSAQADASGRWGGRLIMPAALPSGQPIPSGQLFLVAMDDQNQALASAPFAFATPAEQPEDGPQLVSAMLEAYRSGADVRSYLSPGLVEQLDAGRPAHQVLGLHPVALQGFSFGESYSYPQADLSFLPATLTYQGFSEERVFTVAFHYDASPPAPKIYASELAREGRPVAMNPEEAAQRLLLELWADRSGRRAVPYLAGPLRDRVARGEQVDLLEEGGAGPMLPLHSYHVVRLAGEEAGFTYVEVTVDIGEQRGVTRFVKTQQIDGAWRVAAVLNALADAPPPPDFPGVGWTAWKQGDFNGDGIEETVYLKETGLVSHDRLDDPLLSSESLNATAVLVAQDGAHGRYALLEIDGQSVRTSDGFEIPFAEGAAGPAFFQVALSYAYEGRFLHILPLNAEGYAFTQALAFKWSPAHSAYRPIGGPHGEW